MRPVRTFHVRPCLPDRLKTLEDLAYNLRWAWDHETIALFRRLDRDLWETSEHNPVRMLGSISQERLAEAAQDEAFLAHLDRVKDDLKDYIAGHGAWYRRKFGAEERPFIAYFSMEFGVTECLPIYSGGLGILAGDHLKSASDLGVPLLGVGLLYQKGYFRQYLSAEGWQQERYPVNDFSNMPVRPFHGEGGKQVRVTVDLAGRTAVARVWRAQVGRVTLVLLDANLPENPPEIQDITDELYGGDMEMRIRQEILLGIGGLRALDLVGLRPRVYHMNEGHSAFVVLERIRILMKEQGLSFHEAMEVTAASTVFTTHTPVPAGIDVFPPDMMDRYFASYRDQVRISREAFLGLGRVRPGDPGEQFSMAVLATRSSDYVNGVSRLHAKVSRKMWKDIWPGIPVEEIPIAHVTNGVHPGTWISEDMRGLYDRYLGPRWYEEPGDTQVWKRGEQIPGEELWRTHERRRERLVAFARRRLAAQFKQRGAGRSEITQVDEVLDPEALTIGFARRFATYKRGTLLLRDPERLEKILNAPGRPVQIIYAGKAHPRDDEGKKLIRQLVQLAARPEFRRRIAFIEDYDVVVARYLVQGVDVWLNTPRRPLEASGTSGMKAAFNGALNLSILDGWWDEAYTPNTGWAIGMGEEYGDIEYQDRVEAGALYEILEREVVPLFYARGRDGLPRGWITLMKSAMGELCPMFNTNRMVSQYTLEAYVPALGRRVRMEENKHARARKLAAWRDKVWQAWRNVKVVKVESELPEETCVGTTFKVRAWVQPGTLKAEDLAVQVYLGRMDENQQILPGDIVPMTFDGSVSGDGLLFRAEVPLKGSGTHGFTVRVLPYNEDLGRPHDTALIAWGT